MAEHTIFVLNEPCLRGIARCRLMVRVGVYSLPVAA